MPKLTEFKEKYPDIYAAILEEGKTAGKAEGLAEGEVVGIEKGKAESREEALATGAQTERERIQGIEALAMPGHEAMIQTMKFDGETTPAAAAIKLVQAENAVRHNAAAALAADGIKPVAHAAAPAEGDPPAKDFETLVAEYRTEHKCGKGKATSAVAKANPEAHEEYLKKTNKGGK
ncbi:hypothetical protein ES708_01020 [subsurface metagenome]